MRRIIIHNDRQKNTAIEAIKQLPEGGKFEVRIQKHTKIATQAQMNQLWKMTGQLGDELGYTKKEMHDVICDELLAPVEYVFRGEQKSRPRGYSDLTTTKDKSELIDGLYRWALNEFGVILEMPEDQHYEQLSRAGG